MSGPEVSPSAETARNGAGDDLSVMGHEHEFDGPPKRGHVEMCVDRNCTAIRVGTGRRWRELTAEENLTVTARMMEDIAIADAMVIVHGKERGMKRAREVLGYGQG